MTDRIRSRLSYANVMATIAVFVALGGTSYAVTSLPRNSVGSDQIRANAVGNPELKTRAISASKIRARAVSLSKLSTGARSSLRGQTGPAGPQGGQGPPGVTYRATVSSAGTLAAGNAASTVPVGLGVRRIGFAQSVAACSAAASLARVEGGPVVDPPAGRITVAGDAGQVVVSTFDAAGTPAALPFSLIVAC